MNRDPSPLEANGNGRPEAATDHGRISTDVAPGTGRALAVAAAALAAVLVVGFGVAFAVHHRGEADARRRADDATDAREAVDVVSVRATPSRYPLTLPGQTAGLDQSPLYARVDGYVARWLVDIGDRVRQGQVLATIDAPEVDQQLAAARAKAAASDAQVDVAQSNESIAKLTYDRWRDSPKGVVSEQEREEKQATYVAAKAHVAEAKAQALLDRADVARYSALESFRQVTAPYDGVITTRTVDIGDLVTAGSSANTRPLYTMARYDTIRCFVDVPQKAAAQTTVGLAAHATSDQTGDRVFAGRVARSAMSIDPQTRTERVEVDVPNPDLALVPGMYVQVTFDLVQHGLLQVPAAAILYRPDGLQVAVVAAGGTVDFRPVTIAKDDGDTVELAGGVRAGDKVALNISSAVTPGQVVTAVDDDQDHPMPPPPAEVPAPTEQTAGPPGGARPPSPVKAPVQAVPGTVEPAAVPANTAPLNRAAGGVGGD